MSEAIRMRDCPDGSRRADIGNLFSGTADNPKTADYQMLVSDSGKCFSDAGAVGAVNFTLPTGATAPIGWWVIIHHLANMAITITAADTINGAASKSAANTQDPDAFALIWRRPDGKYAAILNGTWT